MSSKVTVRFHLEARLEPFEAAEFYEERVVGLGDDFIDEAEIILVVVEQQPASGILLPRCLFARPLFG